MDPENGKILGVVLMFVGTAGAFGGTWLLGVNLVVAIIVILVGLAVLGLGNMIRDVSAEVSYERDVLD